MRKTTIYLEDQELEILKQKAFLLNTSIADIIRKSIKTICMPSNSEEEKAMKALTKIRSKTANVTTNALEEEIIKIQRDIRNEKKNKSRY